MILEHPFDAFLFQAPRVQEVSSKHFQMLAVSQRGLMGTKKCEFSPASEGKPLLLYHNDQSIKENEPPRLALLILATNLFVLFLEFHFLLNPQ